MPPYDSDFATQPQPPIESQAVLLVFSCWNDPGKTSVLSGTSVLHLEEGQMDYPCGAKLSTADTRTRNEFLPY